MTKLQRIICFILVATVMSMIFSAKTYAAGGDTNSPYIDPRDTGLNLDIFGLIGGLFYGLGVVFVGYGKLIPKMGQKISY